MDELPGVEGDRGDAHPRPHHRNFFTLVGAGVAESVADGVELDSVVQVGLCDEFCAERVTGQEDGFGDGYAVRVDMRS